MKQILISMLAIAALASCSKSENKEAAGSEDFARIVLNAGVPTASALPESKAPIVVGSTFTAGVAGWESSVAVDYTQAAAWNTTTSAITVSTAAQVITLTDPQVYDADNTIKTYMKAWYPHGTLVGSTVTFTNTDASVDAMLAPAISGSKSDRAGKTLAFAHKTTQLKFIVKKGEGLITGTTIDKITVKGAELPTGFNMATNAVNYAAAADFDVVGITAGVMVIGTTPAGDAAGSPVMIKPIIGNTVTLDITTNHTFYSGVKATIDTDPNFVEGRAYTITLTFGQPGVELKTTVADWTPGTGSGSVQ